GRQKMKYFPKTMAIPALVLLVLSGFQARLLAQAPQPAAPQAPGQDQTQPAEQTQTEEEGVTKTAEIPYVPITMVKVQGQTYVTGGTIKGVQTLSASASPYVFVGDIIIPPGSTLIVEPGVTVKFGGDLIFPSQKPNLTITVKGTLKASGTKEKPILFTANDGTTEWGGILFSDPTCKDSVMQYCQMEAAKITTTNATVNIQDTVVTKEKAVPKPPEEKKDKSKKKTKTEDKTPAPE